AGRHRNAQGLPRKARRLRRDRLPRRGGRGQGPARLDPHRWRRRRGRGTGATPHATRVSRGSGVVMTALLLLGGALLVAPDSRRGARLRSLLSVERERGRNDGRWARLRAGVPVSDSTLLRLLPVLVVPLLPVIGVLQTMA